jgi:endo-1,4-beta-xylanase
MQQFKLVFSIFLLISCISCKDKKISNPQNATLKSVFAKDFLIGTALGEEQYQEKNLKENALILREFNAITPENVMKLNEYDFSKSDQFVQFGIKNKMNVYGHTLIWHSQLSPFVKQIQNKDSFLLFFEDHIKTVAGHYTGKIKGWDVVNEALEEDGTLRKSIFLEKMGEDYLPLAFKLAQKADPNAELYYNDYNIEQKLKRIGAINLLKKIQKSGARIDGVGIQGHWNLLEPTVEEIEQAIIEYSQLGLKVMFTELDITVLPNPWDLKGADVNQNFEESPYMNPYPKELPDDIQEKLAKRYEDLFRIFLKHKDKISRVTFWGVHDGHSWLNGWPIKNRTNYPLLFDRQLNSKLAHKRVIGLK